MITTLDPAVVRPAYITDPWLIRRLPAHFVQVDDPDYMLSIADRGAYAGLTATRPH